MRKLILFFAAVLFMTQTFGASELVPPRKKAAEIMIPLGKSGQMISVMDLSTMKVKEFETLAGKKLSLFDKLSFKLGQRELRKSINPDGTMNSKKLEKFTQKAGEGGGFHFGGFALGFLLGLIGVLIAYLINDDKKKSRVKWSWLGLLVWVALWLVLFVL